MTLNSFLSRHGQFGTIGTRWCMSWFARRFLQGYKEVVLIIESQALAVVKSIIDKETDGSLGHLHSGIGQVLEFFSRWKIKHVKRECNRVTHELAQLARRNEASQR